MPTCKKCQNHFPNRVIVEGKTRNLSSRKYCLDCSPLGERNTRRLKFYINVLNNTESKKCNNCMQIKPTEEYNKKKNENRFSSWCKQCIYDAQKNRWRNRKLEAVKLMGGKCVICGYCRNYAAMEFHHVDPSTKEVIWNILKEKNWEKVIEELEKCILLCSNCHRESHNPNAALHDKYIINVSLQEYKTLKPTGNCKICKNNVYGTKYCSKQCVAKNKNNNQKEKRKPKEKNQCLFCGNLTQHKFCSQTCFKMASRKAERPSKETLEQLLKETNYTQVAKKFGVSDNAVRKWIKSYNKIHQ